MRTTPVTRCTSLTVGMLLEAEDLDLTADDRQRGTQLVRGVGDERALAVERPLQAVEHVVKRVPEHLHLLRMAVRDGHARTHLPCIDLGGDPRHTAKRARDPRRHDEPAGQSDGDRQPARDQERVEDNLAGAIGWGGGLADPQPRDHTPVARRVADQHSHPSGIWKVADREAGRRGKKRSRGPDLRANAIVRLSRFVVHQAQQLGLVADHLFTRDLDERDVLGRLKRLAREEVSRP